jgi:hypothetical protein
MKTEHILITVHFLEHLRKQHEALEQLAPVQSAFLHLLDRNELLKIVQLMYDGQAEKQHPNLTEKTNEEILTVINDQYYVLWYLIDDVFGEYTL